MTDQEYSKVIDRLRPFIWPAKDEFHGIDQVDQEIIEKENGVTIPERFLLFTREFGDSTTSLAFVLGPPRDSVITETKLAKIDLFFGSPPQFTEAEWSRRVNARMSLWPNSRISEYANHLDSKLPPTTMIIGECYPSDAVRLFLLLGMKGFDRGRVFCFVHVLNPSTWATWQGMAARAELYSHTFRIANSFEEFLQGLVVLPT